jgi:H+/Cl- antiporter ClcA
MKNYIKIGKILGIIIISSIVIGGVCTLFLTSLKTVSDFRESHHYIIYILPLICSLTAYVYTKYGKGAEKGNNLIIEGVHEEKEIPIRMAFMTFLFTILTHLSGGSAGREGTAVQMGGTISNQIAKKAHLTHDEKRLIMMSGISAGFGAVFGTPLAGAFFGLEVCYIGKLSYESLVPCFAGAYIANEVTKLFGITHEGHIIKEIPAMGLMLFVVVIISSLLFGAVGKLFVRTIGALKQLYKKYIPNIVWRAFAAGCVILVFYEVFNWKHFAGLSTWMIDEGFSGGTTILDSIRKFIVTCLTLGAGMQGGEVTPLFDLGSSLGGAIGTFTGVEPSLLAALGMIAVFGCAANTPLTTIMLGIELFGVEGAPYYIMAALISYYVIGHTGIYSSQKIYTSKELHFKNLKESLLSWKNKIGEK